MGFDSATLSSDDYRANPAPVWKQMRDEHPLFHDESTDIWWLTRYEDVAAVFADYQTYSASTYELSTGKVVGPTLISRDDYGHVVRRKMVAPDFVGKRLAAYGGEIERCATELIDGFAETGTADLVAQFSARLPVDVISAMLGMVGDGDLFRQWVTDLIMGLAPDPALREKGLQAHQAFCAHIAPALENVDDPERMDHIAKIARADVDGQRLDTEEVTAFCGLLFIAGGETTDKAIANMWWNLLRSQDLFDEVIEHPQRWDAAFSETMRHTPPVISEDRFTTAPVEWHGVELPAGARVRVCMGAAHRDETIFTDPDTFDPHRSDLHMGKELRSGGSTDPSRSGHLGFGLGKHFCIGYELARTEAVVGSTLIAERCRAIRETPGTQAEPIIQGNAFQAVPELRIDFDPWRT